MPKTATKKKTMSTRHSWEIVNYGSKCRKCGVKSKWRKSGPKGGTVMYYVLPSKQETEVLPPCRS